MAAHRLDIPLWFLHMEIQSVMCSVTLVLGVRNTDTYLSGDFILNPMLFCKELDNLRREWWLQPKVYINHNCKITTPYDMLVNQIVERARGDQKHGSCGIGINETVLRYRNHGVGYTITPGCVGSVDLGRVDCSEERRPT